MIHHNVSWSEDLMAGLYTNYESTRGPQVKYKQALDKIGSTRARCVAWLKKAQRKEVMKRKMKKLWQKRMYKLWQKKSWKKLTLGLTRRNQGHLNQFKIVRKGKVKIDTVAEGIQGCLHMGYSKMPMLDPGLVVHIPNVDPEAKLVAQLARIFHMEIEGQIVKEVQKLLATGFIKPI